MYRNEEGMEKIWMKIFFSFFIYLLSDCLYFAYVVMMYGISLICFVTTNGDNMCCFSRRLAGLNNIAAGRRGMNEERRQRRKIKLFHFLYHLSIC